MKSEGYNKTKKGKFWEALQDYKKSYQDEGYLVPTNREIIEEILKLAGNPYPGRKNKQMRDQLIYYWSLDLRRRSMKRFVNEIAEVLEKPVNYFEL